MHQRLTIQFAQKSISSSSFLVTIRHVVYLTAKFNVSKLLADKYLVMSVLLAQMQMLILISSEIVMKCHKSILKYYLI